MPTLQQLKGKYFLNASDLPVGSRIPLIEDGNEIKAIVDGDDYFLDVNDEMTALDGPGDFVYISAWAFEPNMKSWRSSGFSITDVLVNLLDKGVDVRLLLWFSPWAKPAAHSLVD